ncbi:MAG: DUF6198 family protein [Clostridia bacterium]
MQSRIMRLRGELGLLFAMVINSLGIVLMLHSNGGITPVASFPYAIYEVWPVLSLGSWNSVFQCVLVFTLMILRKKIVPAYLCSFVFSFIFGSFVDFHNIWVNVIPQTPPLNLLCYLVGYLLLAFGVSVSNLSTMPILPTDLFPRDAAEIFHIPYQRFKVCYDICCVVFAIVLLLSFSSGIRGIGIGTVFAAFTIGTVVGAMMRWLQKRVQFVSLFSKSVAGA